MRRGEDVESGTVNGMLSKVTSEDGSDGKEKSALANQKLSREQREEAYKQARERIFGNSEKTGESTPDNEAENGMSRASSVSAKDRASGVKRGKVNKQRRDDSDSLDSRHLYGPFGPQQSWVQQPQFSPHPGSQYPAPMPPTYGNQVQTAYTAPGQAYPPPAMHSGYPAYPNMAPIGSPHLSYVGYQQPGPPGPYGGPAGYGMARQGSNNSAPLYHAPPPQHPQHPQHMMQSSPGVPYMPPQPPHQAVVQNPIQHHIPNKPVAPQGPAGQTFSHLPHYGNPATLPQKPNTGI
ncbi:hypothetical protein ACHAQF_004820 [Verticillium nonalfalfae]